MAEDYTKKLQSLLRKLFQFESADLDFGIYRIMNKKRDVIEKFIEKDLIAAVEEEFGKASMADKAQLLAEVEALASELGIGVDDDPAALRELAKKVPALQPLIIKFERKRNELHNLAGRAEHKAEVFNHIYQFFTRYYDNGDFMSMRRYSSKQKFAVPYNGEEVLLHWANRDQYYIKTGEYFFNYTFRVGEYKVRFHIVQAETSVNNNKSENRFFILKSSEGNVAYDAETKELTILFEYRALTDVEKASVGTRNIQETLNQQAKDAILATIPDAGLKSGLSREMDGKNPLAKHLATYAKRNTADYFIHKDLKGFLTQELDFYIKNEMFDLDDLGTEREVPIEQYLNRVRVMKAISLKIIAFLTQIEDFQKKLFEKKKFVLKSEYCMTLDRVPESLYPMIVENSEQIEEWKALYSIGESTGQATLSGSRGTVINLEFLKNHPYLVLDTKFFPKEFKDQLLASFDDLDDATGGLMVKSENWQALNLLQERYREQVDCVYIDPPFNTGSSKILYKNNYEHSSWLALIENRLTKSYNLLRNGSIFEVAIDDYEIQRLWYILDKIFGNENRLSTIPVLHNPGGRHDDKFIATAHEYFIVYAKNKENAKTNNLKLSDEDIDSFKYSDEKGAYRLREFRRSGSHSTREDRPNLYYPIFFNPKIGEISIDSKMDGMVEILPIDPRGIERVWRWGKETVKQKIKYLVIKKIDDEYVIKVKAYLEDKEGIKPRSLWKESKYAAALGTTKLINILGNNDLFSYPKSVDLVKDAIFIASDDESTILDFFAGSGTTAHAVIDLNREDNGNRKFILVEIEKYFDNVTKPRIQKVVYSSEWKDGKPQNSDGISHIFKYLILEQYEDTLNNIEFKEAGTVQKTLMDMDGYFLRYMLDFETRDSPCRMNVVKLERPFEYTLRITRDNELYNETVDLVETFNYLLGLKVKWIRTFSEHGTKYRVVHGETLAGQSTTIIWRTTEGLDLAKDKKFIEETILKDPKLKAEQVYINGDFHVEGALPIEPEFQRLMGA